MKKKTLFVALAALVLLLGAVYLWVPSSVPPGQQTLVTLLTSLPAGGLRSSASLGSPRRGEAPRAGRLGAHPAYRLEFTRTRRTGADFRPARPAVLGSAAPRGGRIEPHRQGEVRTAAAGLLHKE